MLVLSYDDLVDDVSLCLTHLQTFLRSHGIPANGEPEDRQAAQSAVDRSLRHSDSRRRRSAGNPDYASTFAIYEELGALRGTTLRFDIPLPPEDDWVSRALNKWGRQREPQWRDPEG